MKKSKRKETYEQRLRRLLATTGNPRYATLLRLHRMGVLPAKAELDIYQMTACFYMPFYVVVDGKRHRTSPAWDISASTTNGDPSFTCGDVNGKIVIPVKAKDAKVRIAKWIRSKHTKNAATLLKEQKKAEATQREQATYEAFQEAKENSKPTDLLVRL